MILQIACEGNLNTQFNMDKMSLPTSTSIHKKKGISNNVIIAIYFDCIYLYLKTDVEFTGI